MTSTETKAFPTGDVLSAVTGFIVSRNGIGGVYEVLNFMTGESVFTHQLPRIGREAAPVVLALHPELQAAYDEAERVNRDNWKQWLAIWEQRYGAMITVPRMNADQHEHIDPISEAAEYVHPDNIIVIKTEDGG